MGETDDQRTLRADEEPQQLRIRRFLLSAWFYALSAVPMAVTTWTGITSTEVFLDYLVLVISVNLLFYAAFRLGLNRSLPDPSLTVPQITAAVAIFLYVQLYTGPARGAYIVVLLIAFNFGAFRLHTRTLAILSALTVCAYAALLPVVRRIDGNQFDPVIAWVNLLTLTLALVAQSVLIGSFSRLRRRLSASNQQLQTALSQVTELATRDELTGIYNRRYILDILEHERHRVSRRGATFCVCLLDLDHFKQINDSLGHAGGDMALRSFVRGVAAVQRDTDLLARYGGEEFLLFLPETHQALAEACAERIRAETARLQLRGRQGPRGLTVSMGVAEYRAPESLDDLLARADAALYRAKHNGRNRIEIADDGRNSLIA
jgi:diguanylate cyclase (GGDEF)-like protein